MASRTCVCLFVGLCVLAVVSYRVCEHLCSEKAAKGRNTPSDSDSVDIKCVFWLNHGDTETDTDTNHLFGRHQFPIETIEIAMLQHSLGRNPMHRIVRQRFRQQIQSNLVQRLHVLMQLIAVPARKRRLVIGQRRNTRPDLFGRRFQDAKDPEQLIDLRIALKQWLTRRHFGENAANRPDVHRTRVPLRTEQHFRGAIPQRDDFVRIHAQRNAKRTAQPEIGDLHIEILEV